VTDKRIASRWLLSGAVFLLSSALADQPATPPTGQLPEPHPDLPRGYVQLGPTGAVPSVDEPAFVPASEAEIKDDAWVLGVVVGGQARAYSLNLLNHHGVVNDRIGDTSFAAVW
jgi:hypothetical protein